MSLIEPELVPPRTTSLYHTFHNNTTRMTPYDTGEWLVQHSVLRKSQSMTGLRQHPRHVTRLSRMGSLDDIARHVEMWGEKRDTVDTVYAIAENGWFDEEDDEGEEQAVSGRPSREHENDSLLPSPFPASPPALSRKSSRRQKVEKRRAVSNLTKLLERRRVREEPQYDIFGRHLQSERSYRENKTLGSEYGPPGSKETPVIRAALDQEQQEAVERFESPPPPSDWRLPGAAPEEARPERHDLKAEPMARDPVRRDFARAPGKVPKSGADGAEALFTAILASKRDDGSSASAASAVHDAQKETLSLARSAGDSQTTAQKINHAAAKALAAKEAEPKSYFDFEQDRSRKCILQPTGLLSKLKSIRGLRTQRSEPRQHAKVFGGCNALSLKLKQSLRIHRHGARNEITEDGQAQAGAEAASQGVAEARARANAHLNFQTEKHYLLSEVNVARRSKHQRWLEAEQNIARAQDRPPNPVPAVKPITIHKDLEADAQITAIALDTVPNVTPGTKWRSNSQLTRITRSYRSGDIRIIGPPNYGILSLCNLWLEQGPLVREMAMKHIDLIQQGHLPRDHLLSGCECYKYRIYEAFTDNEIKYIGFAQTQKEQKQDPPRLGRWVVYLAKQKPKSKFELGSRMPSVKVMQVPARRPTSANKPQRPVSMKFVKDVKRHSRRIVFFHDKPLRDVGAL